MSTTRKSPCIFCLNKVSINATFVINLMIKMTWNEMTYVTSMEKNEHYVVTQTRQSYVNRSYVRQERKSGKQHLISLDLNQLPPRHDARCLQFLRFGYVREHLRENTVFRNFLPSQFYRLLKKQLGNEYDGNFFVRIFCILFANCHSPGSLTDVFPCYFLSCKANARV